ncbi:MAG TPA: hypothetical protein VFJ02_02885 [Vicinamibacterales bacterium]|nr:hypothetical protein [Vicinamibacterales bacterium]
MASNNERRLEDLLGRQIAAVDGRVVGRIEEIVAVEEGDHYVVSEFHIGPIALLERLAVRHFGSTLPGRDRGYRARWDQVDLSDVKTPRLLCQIQDLRKAR